MRWALEQWRVSCIWGELQKARWLVPKQARAVCRVPEECPKELPPIITACMQLHAANRPSASALAAQLGSMVQADSASNVAPSVPKGHSSVPSA